MCGDVWKYCGNQDRFIKLYRVFSCASFLFGYQVSGLAGSPEPSHEMLSPHSACVSHLLPHILPTGRVNAALNLWPKCSVVG